ncbi:MAG: hypothetical protein JSU01_14695 [Bacteroidetes bacterium]|nr:hypothetical protein [Bacteroidota bacterium]
MKKLSLSALAIVMACATVYANGPIAKTDTTKKECAGQCRKNIKTNTCKDKATCSDMNSCKNRCS